LSDKFDLLAERFNTTMRTKTSLLFGVLCFIASFSQAQIKVHPNNRYLQTRDGKPFFWLGDTDWEMFHRLTRDEITELVAIRKSQGFNVLQAVALAEFNGIRQPNRYGDLPLINEDPTQLAVTRGNNPSDSAEYDYWDHVDFAITTADKAGIYIGLLPTWGDKVAHLWGEGPIIFNETNAGTYARLLAERYSKYKNIIWILGGDRPAVYTTEKGGEQVRFDERAIWRAMATAIEEVAGKDAFITYHPWGNEHSTSQYIHSEPWLDMNAFQSGHGSKEVKAWDWVRRDLAILPLKPTLDMEPCYEDHPVNPWDGKWTRQRGYFSAHDVRARIYRSVFAGACGVTYGHHHIWQFLNEKLYEPVNVGDTLIPWKQAARAEAAQQMKHLKNLMLSRPYFSRIPDQSLIESGEGNTYRDAVIATRDENASYAFIYIPDHQSITVATARISGTLQNFWWFDPMTGKSEKINATKNQNTFSPPPAGKDWVLVIDDASRKFKAPGSVK
jgi:hypothetical protein